MSIQHTHGTGLNGGFPTDPFSSLFSTLEDARLRWEKREGEYSQLKVQRDEMFGKLEGLQTLNEELQERIKIQKREMGQELQGLRRENEELQGRVKLLERENQRMKRKWAEISQYFAEDNGDLGEMAGRPGLKKARIDENLNTVHPVPRRQILRKTPTGPNWELEIERYKGQLNNQPDNPSIVFNLGFAYHKAGMTNMALNYLQISVKLLPTWKAYYYLAYEQRKFAVKSKNYQMLQTAIRSIVKAQEIEINLFTVKLHVGLLLDIQDTKGAIDCYEKAKAQGLVDAELEKLLAN